MEAAIFSETLSAIYELTRCRARRFKYPKKTYGRLLEVETSRPVSVGTYIK